MDLDDPQRLLFQKIGTPSRFAQHVSKPMTGYQWMPGKHLLYLEQRVLAHLNDTENQSFLQVNMPPRHGKTAFTSVFLPAWILGMYPEKRVMLVTYSDDFSIQWGGSVRNILKTFGKDLFNRTVDKTMSSNGNWRMEGSFGGMLAVGIGGGIAGQGADVLIMDDVIKNAEEAASPTTKAKHYAEYTQNIRPRLEPGGMMINVQTRWAEDDLSGQIELTSGPQSDDWERIVFPAVCEPPDGYEGEEDDYRDIIGRKPGEPLWPERWTLEALHRIRNLNELTPATWDALYQQRPVPRGGSMFPTDCWQKYPWGEQPQIRSECYATVRVWDLASSQDSGDWSVGLLMGVDYRNHFYILDVKRFRKHPQGIEQEILHCAQEDGVGTAIRIEQERSGAGSIVVENYKRLLARWDVDGRKPVGTKENRASIYSAKAGSQMIYLPDDGPWVKEYIEECRRFPRGRYDDQVDCSVYAYDHLAALGGGSTLWTPSDLGRLMTEADMNALLGQLVRSA
jgi:predicted phage terminase large subunit-like protein